MAQEFTKEQIFNMSDEEFNKHFNDLANSSKSSDNPSDDNSQMNQLLQQNTDSDNQDTDTESNQKVDESNLIPNDELDKKKNVWQNFNDSIKTKQESDNLDANKVSDDNTPVSNENTSSDNNQVEDESEKPKVEPQTYRIKANGQYFNFTTDELVKLAPKALNYVKKLQKIAPYRRTISAMKENNVTEDEINQFIEMKKGNKTAIVNFLNNNQIDTYDLTNIDSQESAKYQPFKYGREQNELSRVIEDLQEHPRSQELVNYIATLDKVSKERLQANPIVLEDIMNHIENGTFNIISPEANKRAFLDGNRKPLIEYYAECVEEYYNYLDAQEKKKQSLPDKNLNENREKAKVSGNTGLKTQQKQEKQITSAYDISFEELEQWEKSFKLPH